MSKRPGMFNISSAVNKREKLEKREAEGGGGGSGGGSSSATNNNNPFLTQPVPNPVDAFRSFLYQARATARKFLQGKQIAVPLSSGLKKAPVEIEVRLGTLKVPSDFYGNDEAMRVTSSGAKSVSLQQAGGKAKKQHVVHAFLCNSNVNDSGSGGGGIRAPFEGGITRSHFTKWSGSGLSEVSPLSLAFGIKVSEALGAPSESKQISKELIETEMVETVYGGYPKNERVCFDGEHPPTNGRNKNATSSSVGKMEIKAKLQTMDLIFPSSSYDVRFTLNSEDILDSHVREPPPRYTSKRLKRRRTYTRRDKSCAWQLDVTEVSSEQVNSQEGMDDSSTNEPPSVSYEIEVELMPMKTIQLINADDNQAKQLCTQFAQQLWWMMQHMNPLSDVLDVDSFLRPHPQPDAIDLALAQCDAIKRYHDSGEWQPAIKSKPGGGPTSDDVLQQASSNHRRRFIGCMPVNFSRHNIEDVQRCEKGYYLSEKTDGVRYLMIFTGTTVVLIDRSLKGVQPIPIVPEDSNGSGGSSASGEPMSFLLNLIQPGTVLDGEVVMHRDLRRPIFIVFDVMVAGSKALTKQPFGVRLDCLRQAGFRTPNANKDMFAESNVTNKSIALPLVRKNFVRRMELDKLLSYVNEERGHRIYKYGKTHHHCTDGIIFQPNRPYQIGTDVHLLKWKYLDTVTIDVELLAPKAFNKYNNNNSDDEHLLRVGVMGEEGSTVDMTRYVRLPSSERLRLEADRAESGAKIAEVGFDPETGEWYYLTMRPDKTHANHISTVLGTLLELAESLNVTELRYRMSVPNGSRDTWRRDFRSMQHQLLKFQREKNHKSG